MDVIEIGISQMRENPAGRRIFGVVSLLNGGRHVILQCEADLPANTPPRTALLREAFRQYRRMPEYRQGRPPPCRLVPAQGDA